MASDGASEDTAQLQQMRSMVTAHVLLADNMQEVVMYLRVCRFSRAGSVRQLWRASWHT